MTRFYIRHYTNPVIEVDIEQITTYGDREATVAGLVEFIKTTPAKLEQLGIESKLPLTLYLPDGTLLEEDTKLNLITTGTTKKTSLIIKQQGLFGFGGSLLGSFFVHLWSGQGSHSTLPSKTEQSPPLGLFAQDRFPSSGAFTGLVYSRAIHRAGKSFTSTSREGSAGTLVMSPLEKEMSLLEKENSLESKKLK